MRTKVKITKQQIKEDKFTSYMLISRDWILDNWQMLAIGAAIVVVIIVGSIYFVRMQGGKTRDAAERLTKAVAEARRQNYQVAVLELKSIADEFGGEIGGKAIFALANAQYSGRNYDEAISEYQKYIDEYHLDPLTTSSAYAGVAVSLENKQDFGAAAAKFAEALKYYPESPSAPDYYLGAIRNYLLAAQQDQAENLLKEMQDKYPGTDFVRNAARLVAERRVN